MPRPKKAILPDLEPGRENGHHTGPIDLSELYAADTIDVVMTDPRYLGQMRDTGLRIGIRSVYSEEAREAAKHVRAPLLLVDGEVANDAAEVDDNIFEQTIGVTTYWYHADLSKPQRADGKWEPEAGYEDVILVDGEKLPCTPENVRRIYTSPRTRWMQRLVERDYLAVQRFFAAPKTAS